MEVATYYNVLGVLLIIISNCAHVLLLTPREFCNKYVSFEFLLGMCGSLLTSAVITDPKFFVRFKFIDTVSLRRLSDIRGNDSLPEPVSCNTTIIYMQ